MRRFIVEGSRWFFLAVLIYAPWAYGSTRPWTVQVLKVLMAAVVLTWLLGCGLRRKWPRINGVCLSCVLLLLCVGWWMVLNAKGHYDSQKAFLEKLEPLWNDAAGTIEKGASLSAMQRISGLLGILCLASDLMQRPIWRIRTWWTMGLTGLSVILFGLVERIAGAPMIFWEPERIGTTFFGTYFYHANAGAFINLVLPLIFGLAVVAMRPRGADSQRMLWVPAVLVCLAGAFVNVSRAAQVVTAIITIILISGRLSSWLKGGRNISGRTSLVYACLALIALVAIGGIGWISVAPRWHKFSWEIWDLNGRTFALRAGSRMIPDAGVMGFGPGTFEIGFPFYLNPEDFTHPEDAEWHWRYAHDDYLQTVIEWGWAGFGVCAVLFGGGVVCGLTTFFRGKSILPTSDRVLLFASVTALFGIAVHALVDFPLQIASLQLYAAVLLGTCWGSRQWLSAKN